MPVVLAYVPLAQSVQDVWSGKSEYFPGTHSAQVVTLLRSELYLPAAQPHTEAPGLLANPSSHAVHVEA